MKKVLLLSMCVLFVASAFAQSTMKEARANELPKEKFLPYNKPFNMPTVQDQSKNGANVIQIGSSYNVYSILRDGQNQVMYNKDLNTVVFSHRQNADATGGSGIISFDVSKDGGNTWDATNKPVTPSVGNGLLNGNRYPNGTIYNPPGNTDTSNARFFGFGGALTAATGSWGMVYQSSAQLDGSGVKENYYATADTNSLIPGGLTVLPNGDIYALDVWNNNYSLTLYKFTYDAASDDFVQSASKLNYDITGVDTAYWFQTEPNLAFSPDGMTGYAVVHAVTPEHNWVTGRPLIFKTSDGGLNWAQIPSIDWQDHSELIAATLPSESTADTTNGRFPYLRDFDLTVDMNGDLHIFANMSSRSDSLDPGFIWVDNLPTNTLWRIQTNDGTSYSVDSVETWPNTWGDLAGDGSRWFGPRVQASRSDDGSKLFFTYTMTDTLAWFTTANIVPDVYCYAMNLTNGFDTTKVLTKNTPAEAKSTWATLSPVAIEKANGKDYELPIVYGEPTADALSPMNYFYIQGVGFDSTELEPVTVSTDQLLETSSINIFPNPTTGQVFVDLTQMDSNSDIQVVNAVGQVVRTFNNVNNDKVQFNLSSFSAGIYYIRINNDEGVLTKKLLLTK